jgi:hypothetical protein
MPERTRPAHVARRAFAWSLAWIFAAALYLLLIDITDLPELIVGAGAAVLAATGLQIAREQNTVGERVQGSWLLRLYRPLLRVPGDILTVSAMALKAVVRRDPAVGSFRAVRFRAVDDEHGHAGRFALAEAAGSFAPNTFVIGVDEEREIVVAHQLRPTEGRSAIDPLELG